MKISILPVKDYNKKDYHTPVRFKLVIEDQDIHILEALRDKIRDLK